MSDAISASLPADDVTRMLTVARSDAANALHLGIMGDTYTILLSGKDTAGQYTLIDMYIPPGGGPGPHRHDFEESFTVLEGEIETVFRGQAAVVRAGQTINIPANAPHQFQNKSAQAVRLLCICSPSGQDEFFEAIGTPVASRTTPPPKLDEAGQAAFFAKSAALAPKYCTELLTPTEPA